MCCSCVQSEPFTGCRDLLVNAVVCCDCRLYPYGMCDCAMCVLILCGCHGCPMLLSSTASLYERLQTYAFNIYIYISLDTPECNYTNDWMYHIDCIQKSHRDRFTTSSALLLICVWCLHVNAFLYEIVSNIQFNNNDNNRMSNDWNQS